MHVSLPVQIGISRTGKIQSVRRRNGFLRRFIRLAEIVYIICFVKVIKIVQLVIVLFRKTVLRRRGRDYSAGQIKGDLAPLPLRQSIQGQIANTLHAENHRSGQQQCQQHLQTQMLLTHVSAPFPPAADITKRTRPTPPARSSPASHS